MCFFTCVLVVMTSSWATAGATKLLAPSGKVTLQRTPNGGIQPQVVIDAQGVVHLIYFAGDPRGGDIYYVSTKDGTSFSPPLRVNSQPGSAIAIGTIRGAQLAIGKNGRLHVAWMGADKAQPRGPGGAAPMLYSRLDDAGKAFEPQRNLIQQAAGLDGGGSVAADREGNVYVLWHAPAPGTKGEENRHVWLSRSTDEGKHFVPEVQITSGTFGVCGCCGMRGFVDSKGTLHVLYRSAGTVVHRDMYLLTSGDRGQRFRSELLHPWEVGTCPMSSMFLAESGAGTLVSWETDGQVYYSLTDRATGKPGTPINSPGAESAKHSVVATNNQGETLMAWTEGTGWNRGGAVAWQTFDQNGQPVGKKSRVDGVPKWSLVAAWARPDGGWTILY